MARSNCAASAVAVLAGAPLQQSFFCCFHFSFSSFLLLRLMRSLSLSLSHHPPSARRRCQRCLHLRCSASLCRRAVWQSRLTRLHHRQSGRQAGRVSRSVCVSLLSIAVRCLCLCLPACLCACNEPVSNTATAAAAVRKIRLALLTVLDAL